jgi:poly-gamma-glutamate capsule biosynthesis protein CapA/YwtB (metallophosphatase superfamily)
MFFLLQNTLLRVHLINSFSVRYLLFGQIRLLLFCYIWVATPSGANAQTDTLRLLFAGDVMGHTPMIKSAEVAPGKYDYRPSFAYVKPVVEQADLAIANLEVTLPGKPPYKGYPQFRSPDALAVALKEAGFDVLVTANNHSNDSRAAGVINTIETLRQTGFWQTGTFKNQAERDAFYPLILYKNGFRIALLNYTYGTNGIPTDAPTIVNLIDTTQMRHDLAEARSRKPHFIIVMPHWGLEYQLTENPEQRQIADFLIREGADLVVGAHPHVVQPVRLEKVAGREVLVAYSLGNFISNQQQAHTDGGIMFQVDIVREKNAPKASVLRHGYLPVWRYIQKEGTQTAYYALPIGRFERAIGAFPTIPAATEAKLRQYATALRKRIGPDGEWVE